jgi:hypothetical protein
MALWNLLDSAPSRSGSLLGSSESMRSGIPSTNPRHSHSAATTIVDDGTIGTFREKAHYKSPFLARQLSIFFAPARYRVVKNVHSYSEIVL